MGGGLEGGQPTTGQVWSEGAKPGEEAGRRLLKPSKLKMTRPEPGWRPWEKRSEDGSDAMDTDTQTWVADGR